MNRGHIEPPDFSAIQDLLGINSQEGSTFKINALQEFEADEMGNMIQKNLEAFEERGSVIASSIKRTHSLFETYSLPGSMYLVAKNMEGIVVGGSGVSGLAGLPPEDGYGEIRDLVVNESFRGRGLGRKLVGKCLDLARYFGYTRIYLKTTPQMRTAIKLFEDHGFKPIKGSNAEKKEDSQLACYYVLELSPSEGKLQTDPGK